MANITMSDYVGFIFSEITRARVIADGESRRIAELYAQDEVLKSFSVPRFKIPELNLAIPVIVSGAKFSTVLEFVMMEEDFIVLLRTKMNNMLTAIKLKNSNILIAPIKFDPVIFGTMVKFEPLRPKVPGSGKAAKKARDLEKADEILKDLYAALKENSDPSSPENIILVKWTEYFYNKLETAKLTEVYNKYYPKNELLLQSVNEVTELVKQKTYATSTKIENLLVDPETNIVKNNSTDATVFLINARIMEEGIFIKSVKNTDTGGETKIVEFE